MGKTADFTQNESKRDGVSFGTLVFMRKGRQQLEAKSGLEDSLLKCLSYSQSEIFPQLERQFKLNVFECCRSESARCQMTDQND